MIDRTQLTEALAWAEERVVFVDEERHMERLIDAAIFLLDFPTDEMGEAAAAVLDQLIPEAAPSLIRERAAQLVLEAVRRVMYGEGG